MFLVSKLKMIFLNIAILSAVLILASCSASTTTANVPDESISDASGVAVKASGLLVETPEGLPDLPAESSMKTPDLPAETPEGIPELPAVIPEETPESSVEASVETPDSPAGTSVETPVPEVEILKLAEAVTDRKRDKVIETYEEYDTSRMPLLAALPEKDIYLYAVKSENIGDVISDGVVLYVGDEGYCLDWPYMTPRFILPQIYAGDLDKDGKDEISIILYVGSGTGVSIQDLHVVELPGNRQSEADDGDITDHIYPADDYVTQLHKEVSFKTFVNEGVLTGQVTVGSKKDTMSLKEYQSGDLGKVNEDIVFGSIVRFDLEDGKLTAEFGVGITREKMASPAYIGTIFADVHYSDGKFVLKNIRFKKNQQ